MSALPKYYVGDHQGSLDNHHDSIGDITQDQATISTEAKPLAEANSSTEAESLPESESLPEAESLSEAESLQLKPSA